MILKKIITLIFVTLFFSNAYSITVPKEREALFDILRKNKIIGSYEIKFNESNDRLEINTIISIEVKVLFIPAYKFFHESTEIWQGNNLVKINGYTDFEDEREYYIEGYDKDQFFHAKGMDGSLKLNSEILSSNFWNIESLKENELFDTQKGIVRKIKVEDLGEEEIVINEKKVKCKKFTLNATSNPKDKGPFPEYTLWYDENNELVRFKFKNWKDKKIIDTIRRN